MSNTVSPSRQYIEARQSIVAALQVDDEPTKPLLDYVQQAADEIERLRAQLGMVLEAAQTWRHGGGDPGYDAAQALINAVNELEELIGSEQR